MRITLRCGQQSAMELEGEIEEHARSLCIRRSEASLLCDIVHGRYKSDYGKQLLQETGLKVRW